MAKGSACFYCRNSVNARLDIPGWAHDCKLGIDNSTMNGDVEQVVNCPKGKPRFGFQIGGYYSHMWFEPEGSCLRWYIASDGEFPTENGQPDIQFHICEFEQIEAFVKFWRSELEKRGILCPLKTKEV